MKISMRTKHRCCSGRLFFASIILFFFCMLQGCNLITICYDTSRSIKKAASYTNQIPITVEELKRTMEEDTSHYKIVVLYDLCCEPCAYKCKNLYSQLIRQTDTSEIKWLFVKTSSGGMSSSEEFLNGCGIFQKLYYLRDDTPKFAAKISNTERFLMISRFLADCPMINDGYGIPINYIVDKSGRIKLKCQEEGDGSFIIMPMQIEDITKPLRELDFQLMDTIMIKSQAICTPQGCE